MMLSCQLLSTHGQPLLFYHFQTMKRAAQHDAGSDDEEDNNNNNRRNTRKVPSAAVTSSNPVTMDLAAAFNNGHWRRVPRVIRNAVDGAQGQPLPRGYSPAVSVQIPRAHCWAPYDVVVSALRSLSGRNLLEQPSRAAARATLDGLFEHPAPFDADVRFPEGAVYLSLELPPFGPCVRRINNELRRVEATMGNRPYMFTDENMVTACVKFLEAVGRAAGMATSAWAEAENPNKQVLYDRVVFEEKFGLTWTDA
ncbi:hypothetical protein EJB05_19636, partial [Eragrostis curvula]